MAASGLPDLGLSLEPVSQLFTTPALGESVHTVNTVRVCTQDTYGHLVLALHNYQGGFLTESRAVS